MTEQYTPASQGTADSGSTGSTGGTAVAGRLTIRDLAVLGSVAIIFIGSLIPLVVTDVGSFNLWSTTNLFYVGIGMVLPLSVGALFVIRRFSPGTRLRLGSLSLDQYASVVAVFAVFFFFAGTATNFRVGYLVGLIGAVLLMASTTCATWIPVLAADFAGRAEMPAHVTARDAVAPLVRPSSAKPVGAKAPGASAAASGTGAATASGWSASRPDAASHTAAGQVFTPAKDSRAAGAGPDGGATAAFGAAAGAAAVAPSAASSAIESEAPPAAATPAEAATPAAAAPAQGGGFAVGHATAGPAAAEAGAAAPPHAMDPVEDLPTSLNPQMPEQPAEEAPAKTSIAATVNPAAVSAEPFWFAVDRPQNVIDETTRRFVFKLAPGAWILALEDRGTSFLVQDSHGKTGVLLDLVGIERASDSQ